ncbi:MAG: hypothetical protein ACOVOV_08520, partial [Dolichospermum sp.]
GLLSTGFQENIAKLEIGTKQIQNIEVKKQRFEEIKFELSKEKTTLDNDISQLRNALSTNTTTQSVDAKTGQMVTKANNANRKSFETQLAGAQTNRDKLSTKIDALNDSITYLDIQILDMESKASESNELGAVQYVSEITGADIKTVANWFIFMLIFVFDPLAITLVIATNQAFDQRKPKVNIYGEPKPIKPEPIEEPTILETPQPIENTNIETEKQAIRAEIAKITRSGVSGRKAGPAIEQLQNRLRDLENTITY